MAPRALRRWRKLVCLSWGIERDRTGIMTPGEFDQSLDPGLHGRVRREQIGKSLSGIVDTHLHDGRIGAGEFSASFYLAQRRNHGIGIFGEFNRAGIGEIFPLT